MFQPMTISTLAIDSSTNNPIVILQEIGGQRKLPIWIGILEANAIGSALEGIQFFRPMTHDLLKNILELTDVKVNKIEITNLVNNTYFALIYLNHKGEEISIDARPSDAMALSLRTGAPIYVNEDVLSKSGQINLKIESAESPEEENKDWQDILKKLDPEDLGKA